MFVAQDLVEGTLAKGFEFYRSLTAPLHRAVFMMFLLAEVHPFSDGNGRVARVMMNAELVSTHEGRIVVPTVYRNNYLSALRALSHNKLPDALLLVLDFAQRYTRAIDFGTLETARHALERTNAFIPANEADDAGKRLVMPTPELLAAIERAKLSTRCSRVLPRKPPEHASRACSHDQVGRLRDRGRCHRARAEPASGYAHF